MIKGQAFDFESAIGQALGPIPGMAQQAAFGEAAYQAANRAGGLTAKTGRFANIRNLYREAVVGYAARNKYINIAPPPTSGRTIQKY
jgi:hypothetical protein